MTTEIWGAESFTGLASRSGTGPSEHVTGTSGPKQVTEGFTDAPHEEGEDDQRRRPHQVGPEPLLAARASDQSQMADQGEAGTRERSGDTPGAGPRRGSLRAVEPAVGSAPGHDVAPSIGLRARDSHRRDQHWRRTPGTKAAVHDVLPQGLAGAEHRGEHSAVVGDVVRPDR